MSNQLFNHYPSLFLLIRGVAFFIKKSNVPKKSCTSQESTSTALGSKEVCLMEMPRSAAANWKKDWKLLSGSRRSSSRCCWTA